MKKILFYFLLLMMVGTMVSAQNHFVFIQSENKEPFTVNFKNKDYKSTSAGYVIIPRLSSGEYEFTVKFPRRSDVENKYNFIIDKKDVGFQLKADNANNWALTNIQTFVTIRSGDKPIFASANTKKEAAKVAKSETAAIKLKKGINKISEVQQNTSVTLRYLDVQDNKTDTIDIIIPVSNQQKAGNNNIRPAVNTGRMNFLPIETRINETGLSLLAVNQEGYNTGCVNLASGDDFYRLRRKMASESSDEKMILEAKKAAKNKCYTTIQVKNLSSLFLTDAGKLKFFSAMYPLVYDYLQYPTLEKELSETMFIDRFRALVKK